MEPIRILHMIGGLNSGGSQAFVMNVYRKIDRNIIQFDFVIDRADETLYVKEIQELGGKVYTLNNINECSLISYYKQWSSFFKSHSEYKVIHGHVRSVALIYLKIAQKYGLVTIVHSHSTSSGKGIVALIKNILQYPLRYTCDYLFACSDEAGKWLYGNKVVRKNNYRVIKNAIDIEKYIFNMKIRNRVVGDLNIKNKFIIGHVGRLSYPKNHKFLLEVFNEVVKKYNDAVLLLIGDGELRKEIEKEIINLDLKQRVIMTGDVSNVNDYMQAMDVLVFPSIYEGLPVTLIEAQSSGLPCIISDKITDEVCITPYIQSISLSKTANEWADIIISTGRVDRTDTKHYIEESGYDIRQIVEKLTIFYEGIEGGRMHKPIYFAH